MGGQVAAVAAVKPEVKIQIVMEYHFRHMLQVEGCNGSYVPVKSCCGAPVMMFAGGKDFSVFTACPPIKKQLRLVCLPMRRLCAVAGFRGEQLLLNYLITQPLSTTNDNNTRQLCFENNLIIT